MKVDVAIPDLPRQVGTAATLGEPAMANSGGFRTGILELTRQVGGQRLLDSASDAAAAAAAASAKEITMEVAGTPLMNPNFHAEFWPPGSAAGGSSCRPGPGPHLRSRPAPMAPNRTLRRRGLSSSRSPNCAPFAWRDWNRPRSPRCRPIG